MKAKLVPDRTETNRAKLVEALQLMMEGLWQVEPEGLGQTSKQFYTYGPLNHFSPGPESSFLSGLNVPTGLTQTVVAIVGQHEAIVAGTPVVSRDVDAFVDTSPIVVVLTFVHV